VTESTWNPAEVVFRRMTLADVDEVLAVERRAFTAPWSRRAFVTELVDNHFARYVVADYRGKIVGYAGVWVIVDEGHITNIAVDPDYRGRHIGEALLHTLTSICLSHGVTRMTLEVRVSNHVAQRLYRKFGYKSVGVRKGYYTDNNEDALIMWADIPYSVPLPEEFHGSIGL
jgi:[ribosomal protein S18]-alanine N-acetyltransferase